MLNCTSGEKSNLCKQEVEWDTLSPYYVNINQFESSQVVIQPVLRTLWAVCQGGKIESSVPWMSICLFQRNPVLFPSRQQESSSRRQFPYLQLWAPFKPALSTKCRVCFVYYLHYSYYFHIISPASFSQRHICFSVISSHLVGEMTQGCVTGGDAVGTCPCF